MTMRFASLAQPALAVLMLGMLVGSAGAQITQEQQNAIRQSCRSDYQARCSSVPAGGNAALQCLKDNMSSLSPACQSAVAATQGGAPAQAGTASPPPATATPAAPPAARPAPPPPAMSPREEIALMRNACAGDFRRYCRGVQLGGGRALACLADHTESLSPPCRNAMAAARGAR